MRRRPSKGQAKERDGGLWRWLLGLLVFAWVLRSLIVAPFSIPSGSMLPGLHVGDYLLVAKWPYGYGQVSFLFGFPPIDGRFFARLPDRGDVAVFRGPEGNDVIKRVMALPGDTVATRRGRVILNGKPLARSTLSGTALAISENSPCPEEFSRDRRCRYPAFRETVRDGRSFMTIDQADIAPLDDFGPVRVPAGHVFVMGDNRDDSADSRIAPALGGMGFVPVERLIGRAMLIFWSTDGSARWAQPWTWFSAARPDRIGAAL